MRVTRTYIYTSMSPHALKAHPYVGLGVLYQVPEMQRSAGIGEGAGDQDIALLSQFVGLQNKAGTAFWPNATAPASSPAVVSWSGIMPPEPGERLGDFFDLLGLGFVERL